MDNTRAIQILVTIRGKIIGICPFGCMGEDCICEDAIEKAIEALRKDD